MARCIAAVTLLLFAHLGAFAQTTSLALETQISGAAVYLTHAHDGTNRKFILDQAGRIFVMQPGSSQTSVFLDIRSRVLSGGERGLLGLAFHPQFSSNRRFFVNYTRQADGATVIAEFRVSGNPNVADPASELIILTVGQPYANHNGGMIEFGPDNFLYIGMGDGGSGNDPENRAQDLGQLLGKMLRIDVDRPAEAGVQYSSPSSNPFVNRSGARPEIFAYGLRNPWRYSFDRVTGQLYAGDVGQNAREEIDLVISGGNYGWRVFEGTRCTTLGPVSCANLPAIPPIAEYATGQSGRCSVTGGYVYRGTRRSLPYGAYIYGDYCTGEIFIFQNGASALLFDTALNISSFGEDEAGELYVVGLGGAVFRLTGASPAGVSQRQYTAPARGGFSLPSNGSGIGLTSGYTRIQSDPSSSLPNGFAILGFRQAGILVSEASVPEAPLVLSGRILALTGSSTTGIAIANPNIQSVAVAFHFTDADGRDFGKDTVVIDGGQQLAGFLNERPFSGPVPFDGTFSFESTLPVAAIGLKGTINERSDFLMTILPIALLVPAAGSRTFPLWTQGGGWTTEFALVNPSDQPITGSVEVRSDAGTVLDTFGYNIPGRSSRRIPMPQPQSPVGSAEILPLMGATPTGIALFRFEPSGVTLTEAGVQAVASGTAFRMYGEMSAAIRTGFAVANTSGFATTVTVEVLNLNGNGPPQTGTIALPANGQRSLYLDEVPGLTSMTNPFQGIARITSTLPIAVSSLRGRTNERGEYLISATPPIEDTGGVPGSERLFPHFAVGGGYDLQFVLINTAVTGSQTGTLSFFSWTGSAVLLRIP